MAKHLWSRAIASSLSILSLCNLAASEIYIMVLNLLGLNNANDLLRVNNGFIFYYVIIS